MQQLPSTHANRQLGLRQRSVSNSVDQLGYLKAARSQLHYWYMIHIGI